MDRPLFNASDDSWTLVGGEVLYNVHKLYKCGSKFCTVHNPSDHHMREWEMHYAKPFMFRVCPHGLLHPDPDDYPPPGLIMKHTDCDGCCTTPPVPATKEQILDAITGLQIMNIELKD